MTSHDLAIAGSFACIAAFFAVAGAAAIIRRPHLPPVLPAMSDLGPEPPAVANLLANGGRLTPDAVPATLLDLAARHVVDINEAQSGGYTCTLHTRPNGQLTPYESRVLDLLRRKARDGVALGEVLTGAPADQTSRWMWMEGFRREVVSEANRAGICAPRFPPAIQVVLSLLVFGAFVMAFAAREPDAVTWQKAVALGVALVALLMRFLVLGDGIQMVTPAGLASQARWLAVRHYLHDDEIFSSLAPTAVAVRGRYLAYGAALGVAAAAVRAIPMGAESNRRAWTRYGGQWRQVRVSYPWLWPPGWGSSPLMAAVQGIVASALGVFCLWVTSRLLPHISFGSQANQLTRNLSAAVVVVTIASMAVLLVGLYLLLAAIISSFRSRTLTGEAIRLRCFSMGMEAEAPRPGAAYRGRSTVACYIAVYPGTGAHVRAWGASAELFASVTEHDIVTVSVAPLLGRVLAIRTGPSPSDRKLLSSQIAVNPDSLQPDHHQAWVDESKSEDRCPQCGRPYTPGLICPSCGHLTTM